MDDPNIQEYEHTKHASNLSQGSMLNAAPNDARKVQHFVCMLLFLLLMDFLLCKLFVSHQTLQTMTSEHLLDMISEQPRMNSKKGLVFFLSRNIP